MTTDWYKTFFQGITVDMWRQAIQPEWTTTEIEFAIRHLQPQPGAQVLDIPCGHGRHAIELARRGYRVTGVDISTDALAYAKADAEAAGASVEWRQIPMQDFDASGAFDGALHMGNSFGYMLHADTCRFLDRVSRALRPGARFVIDYGAIAEGLLVTLKQNFVKFDGQSGDIHVDIQNEYDMANSRLDTTFRFTRNGETETRQSRQHVYTIAEMTRMLSVAGLSVVGIFGDPHSKESSIGPSGKRFELGDRLWLVAERQ